MDILDGIIADDVLVMTPEFVRAFRLAGCDPACHCCGKPIKVGRKFKLAAVVLPTYYDPKPDVTDQMLCGRCSVNMLKAAHAKKDKEYIDSLRRGGYTRKHRDHLTKVLEYE